MRNVPGTLREGGARFQDTRWTVVLLAAQGPPAADTRHALDDFCAAYRPPLYAFVRRRGLGPEDAEDAVQGFFAHLIEANTLSRASREKGRLRTFLLGTLQNFLAKGRDRAQALKRGGGQVHVPLDEHFPEAEAVARTQTDEVRDFDREWAASLAQRSWQHVEEAFSAEGKAELFAALKPLVVGGVGPPPSQEETAARLGVPVATLRTHLHRLRQRFRAHLHTEVGATVSNPAETDEEMRYLYRVLAA